MAPNKADKIKALFKLVQKRHKHAPPVPKRSVLEHLMYAAVLEDATLEAADAAFAVLEHHYIDWNEIRVSTAQELADTLPMLPNPLGAGDRIKKTLQAVFETYYMFDLEDLCKKTIAQASDYLRSIAACSRFMADYTILFGLGGHVIPMDETTMRIFRLLGLAQVTKDGTREEVPGIERSIAKNLGATQSMLLHLFALGFHDGHRADAETDFSELRELLEGIDPAAAKRECTPPVLLQPPRVVRPMIERPAPPLRELKPQIFEDDPDTEGVDEHTEPDAEVDFTEAPTISGTSGFDTAPFEDDKDRPARPVGSVKLSKAKTVSKPVKDSGKKLEKQMKSGEPTESVHAVPAASGKKTSGKPDGKASSEPDPSGKKEPEKKAAGLKSTGKPGSVKQSPASTAKAASPSAPKPTGKPPHPHPVAGPSSKPKSKPTQKKKPK